MSCDACALAWVLVSMIGLFRFDGHGFTIDAINLHASQLTMVDPTTRNAKVLALMHATCSSAIDLLLRVPHSTAHGAVLDR